MITLLVVILLLLIFAGGSYMFYPFWGVGVVEEEITTIISTTSVEPGFVGDLTRQKEGSQFFVIDPHDKDKVWLNDKDDIYEDGAGKWWRLV